MNRIFIWKDQKFYSNNGKVKEKTLSFSDRQHILWKHYTSLRDTNEKVICSQDLCNKMNDKQRSYIIFVQNPAKPNEVHARANTWFYVGLAKAKATNSLTRYSYLLRKLKITDSQLAPLKQKYKDFALTWFWEFKTKTAYDPWFTTQWFHDEVFGDTLYNTPTIARRVFKYKDKNLREHFSGFLNCTVIRPNQTLHIKPLATLRAQLNETSNHIIHLVKEIGDINKYKIEQENYFSYDDSNMIKATFISELNKRSQIYGPILYFGDDKKNIAKLVTPQKRLKFTVKSKNYKENIALQLVSTKSENVIVDKILNKINNFSILTESQKRKKNRRK